MTYIEPTWNEDSNPNLYERVKQDKDYVKLPLKEVFEDRGIEQKELPKIISELPEGALIAGGYLRDLLSGDECKDIDFFFTSADAMQEMIDKLEDRSHAFFKDYKTKTNMEAFQESDAYSQEIRVVDYLSDDPKKPKIQLVKSLWYDSPQHLIDTFDFTVSQFATDGKYLYANPVSFIDLHRKKLVLHRMTFPVSTLRRLIKYTGKGYYACGGALASIAQSIIDLGRLDDGKILYVD